MTYYHPSKEAAKAALEASGVTDDPRVLMTKIELEPDNGWVIVVIPKPDPLEDLHDRFEVRSDGGRRLSKRPASHRRPTAPPPKARRESVPVLRADPGTMLVKPAWLR